MALCDGMTSSRPPSEHASPNTADYIGCYMPTSPKECYSESGPRSKLTMPREQALDISRNIDEGVPKRFPSFLEGQ